MYHELDKSGRRALEANVKPKWYVAAWRAVSGWWSRQPTVVVVLFSIVACAALFGVTGWEMLNSARGWQMLAKDAAPPQLAFMAGISTTVAYIAFHRRAAERAREVDDIKELIDDPVEGEKPPTRLHLSRAEGRAFKALAATIAFASLSLWGIFSNLASKTAMTSEAAVESSEERNQLLADITVLSDEVSGFNVDLVSALISTKTSRITSMVSEARGWGMPDLDAEGACAGDLKPRQRDLCNGANGSVDSDGLRGEILALEADLQNHYKKRGELERKQKALDDMVRVEGAQHWQAMQKLSAGSVDADMFRIWGMFLVSVIGLFAAGFGWDELFEQREKFRKVK